MRQTFFGVLAVTIAGVISLPAQSPTIVFDAQTKDFGKVTEGERLKHVFKFSNKGAATLEILSAQST
ncbi:MAG: hypothetical protein DMG07_07025 [Acidobacteria bacterium]|jgi:hypothetical protein|nr:MAG: hypothetical protein DMG07_07025 [Acidobacteriota bacterium]